MSYDSTQDALSHIESIQNVFNMIIIPALKRRASLHDSSKLTSPEKECYDKYIPMLQKTKYGTPEYDEVKRKMKEEGLNHHFAVNRHHPEHFSNGVYDMDMIDAVEMMCDWFAASLRSDTPFSDGLKINAEKYHLDDLAFTWMLNTYKRYFEDYENLHKKKDILKAKGYSTALKLNQYDNQKNGFITETELNNNIKRIEKLENNLG